MRFELVYAVSCWLLVTGAAAGGRTAEDALPRDTVDSGGERSLLGNVAEAPASPPPPPPPPPPPEPGVSPPSAVAAGHGNSTSAAAADTATTAQPQPAAAAGGLPQPAAAEPVASESSPPGSDNSIADEILALHNARRARHIATPQLTWSAELEAAVAAWAQGCLYQHSGAPGLGENLYQTENYPAYTALGPEAGWRAAMEAWYDAELPGYNWAAPSFVEPLGHFTQIVWAATQQVGCGRVASCGDEAPGRAGWARAIYVCNYWPPGNVDSSAEFQANVLPLK